MSVKESITPIAYTTRSAMRAAFTGLPLGVLGVFENNRVTIYGTPTIVGTYNYTVTVWNSTGGIITATGSIMVSTAPV